MIDLDGHFGLHPALTALQPLWKRRQLAFIHACGSPDPDRSHFEAQAYMETATPGIPSATTGWMNRLAAAMRLHQAADVVAFGTTTPLIVRGPALVATFPTGRAATHPEAMDRGRVQEAFDRVYLNNSRLSGTYREALRTRSTLLRALDADMSASAQGAPDPSGFPADAVRAAHMMTADPKLRLVFFQLGGWDTHVAEGAGTDSLQITSNLWAMAWLRSRQRWARSGATPWLWWCRNSAALCVKTVIAAPTTVMAMHIGYWVAPLAAATSTATGAGYPRASCIRTGICRSPPIFVVSSL